MGIKPSQLDCVLLTHLDCDHAAGLSHVREAKRIIVARADMDYAMKGSIGSRIRYNKRWWRDVNLELIDWNGKEGPAQASYDLLGDGSIVMVNLPGHSPGLCAVRIRNNEIGRYIILAGDGGYAHKSWCEMIQSGVADDREAQRRSLQWLHDEDLKPECLDIIATHDTEIEPQTFTL